MTWLALIFVAITDTTFQAVPPSRYLPKDEIWEGKSIISGEILVPKGVTLLIKPGTHILFTPGTGGTLIVEGTLVARGTRIQTIVFTSASSEGGMPRAGDWKGIAIKNPQGEPESILENVKVSYAEDGVTCLGSSPEIKNSSFENNIHGLVLKEISYPRLGEKEESNVFFRNVIDVLSEGRGPEFVAKISDPNTTRLFVLPTGETLKKGEAYFADYELFLLQFGFGVTDWIQIGGQMTAIPYGNFENQLYSFDIKIRPIKVDMFSLSFLVNYSIFPLEPDFKYLSIGGSWTVGNENYGIHFAIFKPFYLGSEEEQQAICGGGGFGIRISPHSKLMVEILSAGSDGSSGEALIYGIRFFGKSLSADIGFGYPLMENVDDIFLGLPIVDFTYHW